MKAELERPGSGDSSTEDLRFDTPSHHHPAFSLASMAGK
jgi:hypothetical protein